MTTILGSKDFVGKFNHHIIFLTIFIAPEIISEVKYDSKVDCWSLGVIIYQCLSGDLPFYHNDEKTKFDAIKACQWEFSATIWDDISDEAKDLISKLLVANPSERLSCDEILEHEWFNMFD